MTGNENLFYLFIIILNLIIIKNFNYISNKISLYDLPDFKRKIHKEPISLLGGSLIFFNMSLALIYICLFQSENFLKAMFYIYSIKTFVIFLIVITSIFLIGYLDDKFNLSPTKKFFLLFIIIFILIMNDSTTVINKLNFEIFNFQINFLQLSLIFSICCYVYLIISLNMYDGVNLQSSIFYLTNFLMINYYIGEINIIITSVLISIIFFTYLNLKNKAFLGDSGVFILSFILGYVYVKLYNNTILFNTADIVLFLFLPIIDSLRVMFERQFIMNKPIFIADKLHFHHKLLKKYELKTTLVISSLFVIVPHIIFISPFNLEYFLLPFIIIYFLIIYKLKAE